MTDMIYAGSVSLDNAYPYKDNLFEFGWSRTFFSIQENNNDTFSPSVPFQCWSSRVDNGQWRLSVTLKELLFHQFCTFHLDITPLETEALSTGKKTSSSSTKAELLGFRIARSEINLQILFPAELHKFQSPLPSIRSGSLIPLKSV